MLYNNSFARFFVALLNDCFHVPFLLYFIFLFVVWTLTYFWKTKILCHYVWYWTTMINQYIFSIVYTPTSWIASLYTFIHFLKRLLQHLSIESVVMIDVTVSIVMGCQESIIVASPYKRPLNRNFSFAWMDCWTTFELWWFDMAWRSNTSLHQILMTTVDVCRRSKDA